MKEKMLYFIWAVLFIVCVALGMNTDAQGAEKVATIVVSVLFFIPRFILVLDAVKSENKKTMLLIRCLSIASLSLTVLMLVISTLAATSSGAGAQIIHTILLVVSTPMFASHYWIISLFLWASLLMLSIPDRKKKK